jgi:subtilisin family serine protease/uncharacterized protein YodC (DUF2158 family)
MKKRTLLFTGSLLLGIGSLTLFQMRSSVAEIESAADQSAIPASYALTQIDEPSQAPAETQLSKKVERRVIPSQTWGAENQSGHQLDNIPFGVSRVDEVLFEEVSRPDEEGLVQRIRVLKTDFHFPLVQTVELLEQDPATGANQVVEYMAMVADHVMVQVDLEATPVGWEAQLAARGVGLRRSITSDGLFTMEFAVDKAGGAFAVISELRHDFDWIRFAEPDLLISPANAHQVEAPMPNDPSFPSLWGLENGSGVDINAREGWRIRTGAPNIVVAIMDAGVDFNHPDLKANMWVNPRETVNGLDDSGNGFVDDIHGVDVITGGPPLDFDGHGTHVAGTIGAVGNNGLGVTGVAWDVQLMAVKILGPGGTLSGVVVGIDYAWSNGAHILNNSWGVVLYGSRLAGTWRSEALGDAVARTRNAGAIFVAASGNDGVDVDVYPDFPAGHQARVDNVVNVGALRQDGNLAVFSNYGVRNVQVAAPGDSILSTYPNGGYQILSGTSMAAPHVAGILALLMEEFPQDPYGVIIQRLYQRSERDPRLTPFIQGGRRVDLGAALDPSPLVYKPLVDTFYRPGIDELVHLSVGVSGKGILSYQWFKDDQELPGEKGPSISFSSPGAAVSGHYRVEISSPYGVASSVARVRAAVGNLDLKAALGDPTLSWFTSTEAPWTVDGGEARSGAISHRQATELRTQVAGPGKLTFSWRVSSELSYDKLQFVIGETVLSTISGESGDLLNRTYDLPVGQHELIWRYSKDGSRDAGIDAGWLWGVTYEPLHPVIDSISRPGDFVVGEEVTLEVKARGPSLTYSWRLNGVLLSGQTGPSLTRSPVENVHAGSYSVTVANDYGYAVRTINFGVVPVATAPVVFQHSNEITVGEGSQVVLFSDFEATGPWTIQWFKDGSPLEGETDVQLNLGGLSSEKTGSYTYIVTNSAGFDEALPTLVMLPPQVETFAAWLARFGGREAVEAASGDGVDPLLRFALGVEPGESLVKYLPRAAIVASPQIILTNLVQFPEAQFPSHMALLFERPTLIEGVIYILEASADLREWATVESAVEVFDLPGEAKELVQLREVEPIPASAARRFLRMRVELSE